jgi:hypothetical protein
LGTVVVYPAKKLGGFECVLFDIVIRILVFLVRMLRIFGGGICEFSLPGDFDKFQREDTKILFS